MRIEGNRIGAIEGLQPAVVQQFLLARGWIDDGAEGLWARAFVKRGYGDAAQVLLITRANDPDYPRVLSLLLGRAADVKGMTVDALVRELSMAAFDILKVRMVDAEAGVVDLDSSLTVIREARGAILAAAHATAANAPRRSYAGRQPESVGQFMSRVKMGQTELGSFVVPLLSPYTFDEGQGQTSLFRGEWFGRRVMKKLTSGLQAVERALSSASRDAFAEGAPVGVSANLCQALGRMVSAAGRVELSVRWATLEPEPEVPAPVMFVAGADAALLSAAARLAEAEPPPSEPILGFVTKLIGSDATVATVVDGRLRNVHLSIPEAFRATFASAWRERTSLMLMGELALEGKHLTLRTVEQALLTAPDPDEN